MGQKIVLGMGTGQCGLNLLAEILGKQVRARVSLEQPPLLPWYRRPDRPGVRERLQRWAKLDADLVGDVAAFYLPYAEDAVEADPDIRMVCLKRPREEVVAGFSQQLDAGRYGPMDHWSEEPRPGFRRDPLWTHTFPKFTAANRADALGLYWDDYASRSERLAHRFPEQFRVFDTEILTTESGVTALLDFVGIERVAQVPLIGRRPESPPKTLGAPVFDARHPMDPRRCAVLVPFTGFIHQECDSSLKELERRGYQVRRVGGFAAIDQGRNQMSTDALVEGFDETLWIDSDVGFHPDEVDKLRSHDLPIVCGIYPQKGKKALACHVMPGSPRIMFGKQGGLTEILYAGTGFLLVRREVYLGIQKKLELPVCNERFGHPMIPYFHPMLRPSEDGFWYLAEDYAFCERARQSGYRVFADTTIRLWHVGTYRYGWEDAGMDRPRFDSFTLNFKDAPLPASDVPAHGSPAAPSSLAQIAGFAATYPWPAERPDSAPATGASSVLADARRALDDTTPRQAQLVVEVGSGLGGTTRHLADLVPHARVIAVDNWSTTDRRSEAGQDLPNDAVPYDTFLLAAWDYRGRIIPVRAEPLEGIRVVANAGLLPELVYFNGGGASPGPHLETIAVAIDLFPLARIAGTDPALERNRPGLQRAVESRGRKLELLGNSWRISGH